MAQGTAIEWAEASWNPVTGCTKISAGCKNCYAETQSAWLKKMNSPNYRNGFELTLHPHMLEHPIKKWKKPLRIFVNSMSDLFHEGIPELFLRQVFDVMRRAHWHQFLILTKRPERALELSPLLPWPANVWMGATVENKKVLERVDILREIPAQVRFLSVEPLLESIVPGLVLDGIHWVIVGGESGAGAREMKTVWAQEMRDLCVSEHVPFFFKQWGGPAKWQTGRKLDGRTWDEMPGAATSAPDGQGLLL
jgi:protein gp37